MPDTLGLEAYGVRLAVRTNSPSLLEDLPALLPPGWTPGEPADADHLFEATTEDGVAFHLELGRINSYPVPDPDFARRVIAREIQWCVARNSPNHIFVHAGAVAGRHSALLLPGMSFAGKTTLVAALVRAGAVYYSDEFAVLDADGAVHPYARPLVLREPDGVERDERIEDLGGTGGSGPLPVGAVVVANYRAGAKWQPQPLSEGEAAMALLANTVPAQERPEQALAAVTAAVTGTVAIKSERDEAAPLAREILALVE